MFTVSLVGKKLTFLIGPEVSGQFYQGLDSEVSLNMFEFTVPMLGKDIGYSVDSATRYDENRFWTDAFKPTKLRSYIEVNIKSLEIFTLERANIYWQNHHTTW